VARPERHETQTVVFNIRESLRGLGHGEAGDTKSIIYSEFMLKASAQLGVASKPGNWLCLGNGIPVTDLLQVRQRKKKEKKGGKKKREKQFPRRKSNFHFFLFSG
jgi:hypothetical protein